MGTGRGFLIVDGKHDIDAVYEKPRSHSMMPLFNIHRSVIVSGGGFIVIVVLLRFLFVVSKERGPSLWGLEVS